VLVTTQVPATQRRLLGSGWQLDSVLYRSSGLAAGESSVPIVVTPRAPSGVDRIVFRRRSARLPDDVAASMLGSLECGRLGDPLLRPGAARDSLETRCNLR
jgi:hypothetical protein